MAEAHYRTAQTYWVWMAPFIFEQHEIEICIDKKCAKLELRWKSDGKMVGKEGLQKRKEEESEM